jgi:transcription elongation factor SPT6
MNCASFIRIREKDLARTVNTRIFDVLDDTRIHPEDYELARKMAADALDIDDVQDDEDPSAHVKELMEDNPERVNLLLLDDYAKELAKTNNELKR